jgi:hypothetical protein
VGGLGQKDRREFVAPASNGVALQVERGGVDGVESYETEESV